MKNREEIESHLALRKSEAVPIRQEGSLSTKMDDAYVDIDNFLEELRAATDVHQALLQLVRYTDRWGETWGWIHALEWVLKESSAAEH